MSDIKDVDINDNNYFGNQLKIYRKMNRLTQTELAEKLGIKQVSLARYENGIVTPRKNTIKDFAYKIGIEESYFIKESGPSYYYEEKIDKIDLRISSPKISEVDENKRDRCIKFISMELNSLDQNQLNLIMHTVDIMRESNRRKMIEDEGEEIKMSGNLE